MMNRKQLLKIEADNLWMQLKEEQFKAIIAGDMPRATRIEALANLAKDRCVRRTIEASGKI